MIDFYMLLVRAFLYTSGFLLSVYYLYTYKVDKKLILDFIIIFSVYILIDTRLLAFYKDLIFLAVGFVIIFFHHKENVSSSLLFSFVIFFKSIFSFPLYSIAYASNQLMRSRISTEHSSLLGITMILSMSILVAAIYFLGAIILKKTIDIRRERLYPIYFNFSLFTILMIFIIFHLQDFTVYTMIVDLPVGKQYGVLFYKFIGLALFPFLGIFLLKRIHTQDIENEVLEKELLKLNNTRMLAYRYTHNINSIMLTMTILAKKKDKEAMIEYLDHLEL